MRGASRATRELPHEHGVHTHNQNFSTIDTSETICGDLDRHRTVGLSTNVYAGSEYGFDTFFDEFDEFSPFQRFPDGLNVLQHTWDSEREGLALYIEYLRRSMSHSHPVQSLLNGVVATIDDRMQNLPIPKVWDDGATVISKRARRAVRSGPEPLFLFMNYMDAHGPFQPVRGFDRETYSAPNSWHSSEMDVQGINFGDETVDEHREAIAYRRELYGAAIDYLDRTVSSLVESVRSETDRETTFIITADHGDNLGFEADNNLLNHTSSLTEGLLHVPLLLINPPDGVEKVQDGYVSHLDLRTLVRGVARDEVPSVGTDRIAAEVVGKSGEVSPPDESEEYWDRMIRCVYEDSSKTVWDSVGNVVSYDLDHDRPCWQQATEEPAAVPDWAAALFSADIETYKREQRGQPADGVDGATESRLERLGYL